MQVDSHITAIVLTAGLSSRMNRCKLSLPFKDHTIIQEVIMQLLGTSVSEIIIVTGHYREEIETLIPTDKPIQLVHNSNYEKGMTTSIQYGIQAAKHTTEGYMICLGDMPFIQTEDYNSILKQFLKHSNQQTIVRPFYQNKPGNPTIFSHHFKDEILNLDHMDGAKPLLKKFKGSLVRLEMENDSVIRDIDTRLEYDKIK
ncbi:nucleotidyltransferase family protein [Spongiivirga sp. MCCC 1A20706]|uniref:nucleotidyltransferase family protein n=1 Tax=Spongiivirga sp. MCCC 1A20706 TaxID=3160963 RepID=UPI003977815E